MSSAKAVWVLNLVIDNFLYVASGLHLCIGPLLMEIEDLGDTSDVWLRPQFF